MRDSEIACAKQRAAIVGGSVGVMLGGVVLGIVAWMNSGSPGSDESGADSDSYYGATDAGSVRRKLKQIAFGDASLSRDPSWICGTGQTQSFVASPLAAPP